MKARRTVDLPQDEDDRNWRCSVRRGLRTEIVHGTLWACVTFALRALLAPTGADYVHSFEIARNVQREAYPEG